LSFADLDAGEDSADSAPGAIHHAGIGEMCPALFSEPFGVPASQCCAAGLAPRGAERDGEDAIVEPKGVGPGMHDCASDEPVPERVAQPPEVTSVGRVRCRARFALGREHGGVGALEDDVHLVAALLCPEVMPAAWPRGDRDLRTELRGHETVGLGVDASGVEERLFRRRSRGEERGGLEVPAKSLGISTRRHGFGITTEQLVEVAAQPGDTRVLGLVSVDQLGESAAQSDPDVVEQAGAWIGMLT